jgi:hypothetical protein
MSNPQKPAVIQYASKALLRDIDRLLDDPHGFAKAAELRTYWIPLLKKVAVQCGLNWNRLVSKGSPYEQERLRRIESGEPVDSKSLAAFAKERVHP